MDKFKPQVPQVIKEAIVKGKMIRMQLEQAKEARERKEAVEKAFAERTAHQMALAWFAEALPGLITNAVAKGETSLSLGASGDETADARAFICRQFGMTVNTLFAGNETKQHWLLWDDE